MYSYSSYFQIKKFALACILFFQQENECMIKIQFAKNRILNSDQLKLITLLERSIQRQLYILAS